MIRRLCYCVTKNWIMGIWIILGFQFGYEVLAELAESLMMPVLPREGKLKSESKSAKVENKIIKETSTPAPLDVSFNNTSLPTPPVTPNLATSQQMVHVEKPKAENLQACSVAFLPVTPMFPKENISAPPPVFQAPPLLSCQAFECFDVLTSIMQASGYQVASQMGGVPQTFDPAAAYNLSQQKVQGMQAYPNFPPKMSNVRLGRKRRRGRSRKMEGLNLSKKIHTKPIVSATIANSIAQLKIDPVVTSDRRPQHEPTQTAPLCLVKPKSNKRIPCYKSNSPTDSKGLDLSKKSSETVTSTQCSVIVSTSDSSKFNLKSDHEKDKGKEKHKASRSAKKAKIADMLPDIYDFTEDSNLSTNLEASRIEKCAKEMLEFMNQKVENTKLSEEKKENNPISSECIKEKHHFINQKVKDINLNKERTEDTAASVICAEEKTKNSNFSSDMTEISTASDKAVREKLKDTKLNDGKTNDTIDSNNYTGRELKNTNKNSTKTEDTTDKSASNIYIEEKLKNTKIKGEKTEDVAASSKCAEEKLMNIGPDNGKTEDILVSNKCDEEKLINTNIDNEKSEDTVSSNKPDEERVKNIKLNDRKTEDLVASNKYAGKQLKNINLNDSQTEDTVVSNEYSKEKLKNAKLKDKKENDTTASDLCTARKLDTMNQTIVDTNLNEEKKINATISNKCSEDNSMNHIVKEEKSNDMNQEDRLVSEECISGVLELLNEELKETELMDKNKEDMVVSEVCSLEICDSVNETVQVNELKDIKEEDIPDFENCASEMFEFMDNKVEDIKLKDKGCVSVTAKVTTEISDFISQEVDDAELKDEKKKDMYNSGKYVIDMIDFMNLKVESTNLNNEKNEDMPVSEKNAPEILDFMNQEIDEVNLNDEDKEDISVSKAEMDKIFQLLETENDSEKDFDPVFKKEDDINKTNLVANFEENNITVEVMGSICPDSSIINLKSNDNKNEPSGIIIADSVTELSKDSTTEDTVITPKSDETITENSKDKVDTVLKSFENLQNLEQRTENDDSEKRRDTEEELNINKELKHNICDAGMPNNHDDNGTFSKNDTVVQASGDKENMKKDEEKEMETDEDDDDESSTELIFVKLDDDFSMDDLTDDDISLKPADDELNKEVLNYEQCETKINSSELKNEEVIKENSDDILVDVTKEENCCLNSNINNTATETFTLNKENNKDEKSDTKAKGNESNAEKDSEEICTPMVEATTSEPKGECSKTGNQEISDFGSGNNETKNINYSILKKDCVVVIKLRNDLEIPKEYCSGIGQETECQDKDNEK